MGLRIAGRAIASLPGIWLCCCDLQLYAPIIDTKGILVKSLHIGRFWCTKAVWVLARFFLGSCGSIQKIPVKGLFFGEELVSTVDSEVAHYLLEGYLQGKRGSHALDLRITALYAKHEETIPSREELKNISAAFSVDFAALFFADRLLHNACNRRLNLDFRRLLNQASVADISNPAYLILFVPGWDYAENGRLTGADFAKPRALATKLGFENHLVALPPTGSVTQNAGVLAIAIAKHGRSGKKILLAGASSAGPAIQLALSERLGTAELESVKAWLNLGGILQGSPLIDYFQQSPQSWLFDAVVWHKDWDKEAILSMGTKASRSRFARLRTAADILTINYLGIPLSGQLSQYSSDKYPLLRPEGPNDGLTLLTDGIAPNSLTVVALGSDHFFAEDPSIDEKTVALMKLIVSYLENDSAHPSSENKRLGCKV